MRKKTKEEVVEEFKNVHGDKYDYSLVKYLNNRTKVKIKCKIHGVFEQSPSNHLKGKTCRKCSIILKAKNLSKSNSQIIFEFRKIHEERYDYSKVIYKGALKKVFIECKIHGIFEMTPSHHLRGFGCPDCSEKSRYDTPKIITKFRKVHGDRYDYSRVEFLNTTTKVKIICKEHGEFKQSPGSHLSGHGCPDCSGRFRYNTSKIISKFIEVHGDKYEYSKVEFTNTSTKVKIICKEHGEFLQTPSDHRQGYGCPDCAGNFRYNTAKIVSAFKKIHGDGYDYSKVNYEGSHIKVKITCKIHGIFEQTPTSHLSGRGCPDCGGRFRYDSDRIILKFREVHGSKYDYSLVEYTRSSNKVKIVCKDHGLFEQSPSNHLKGKGCPICNKGWSKEKIIQFINSIDNHDLLHMDAIELQMIINQGKLPDALNALVFSDDSNRDNTIKALKEKLKHELERDIEETEEVTEDDLPEPEELDVDEAEESDILITEKSEVAEITKDKGLISLAENFEDLHVLDNAIVASCDDEAVEFLIQYKLRVLWNKVLNQVIDVEKLRQEPGGANFALLKQHFFDEYNEVIAYTPPKGYSFPYKLNAMQQLTVYRVLKNKRYGNWSGTGAGKTISFIVTSRAVDARLTLLVGLNSTIAQLGEAIQEVYPDSKIFTRYTKGQVFDRDQYNYLILNYDKFQQGYSEELFQYLSENNRIDFIAIDEVHNVKQRTEQQESLRRGTLKRLVGRASETNPDLYVLGMSATPVINNLTEAKSLLEMITGKEYEDLNTNRTLTNALEVFKQMTLNGLRYIPKYQIVINELDGSNTSPVFRTFLKARKNLCFYM